MYPQGLLNYTQNALKNRSSPYAGPHLWTDSEEICRSVWKKRAQEFHILSPCVLNFLLHSVLPFLAAQRLESDVTAKARREARKEWAATENVSRRESASER